MGYPSIEKPCAHPLARSLPLRHLRDQLTRVIADAGVLQALRLAAPDPRHRGGLVNLCAISLAGK